MIFKAEVLITPRLGVLDTQGKAVEKTLAGLGYEGLDEVRVGRIVRMKLKAQSREAAIESVKSMCCELLVNELIETYEVTAEEAGE